MDKPQGALCRSGLEETRIVVSIGVRSCRELRMLAAVGQSLADGHGGI